MITTAALAYPNPNEFNAAKLQAAPSFLFLKGILWHLSEASLQTTDKTTIVLVFDFVILWPAGYNICYFVVLLIDYDIVNLSFLPFKVDGQSHSKGWVDFGSNTSVTHLPVFKWSVSS